MKSRRLSDEDILIFETGDEVISTLAKFAEERNITAAHFTAIGAFRDAELGYFDWEKKDYLANRINEQTEVVSLTGDIATDQGKPKVHVHVVLGKRDGVAMGGHLLKAHVRPTLELVLKEVPRELERKFDPASGLALIDPEKK